MSEATKSIRVRVALEVGYVKEDGVEYIDGEIEAVESYWAGGDLSNADAVALYDKLRDLVLASNPQ